jgi:hypothetical protein
MGDAARTAAAASRPRLNLAAAQRLAELAGYPVPFAVRAAAELGVADHLAAGPDLDELAGRLGCHARSLLRLLRTLATAELVVEHADGRFTLTADGELLRADHPYSVRDSCRLVPAEVDALALLDHAVRGEGPAFDLAHGMSFWDHLDRDADASLIFDRSQDVVARLQGLIVARARDWSSARTVVDVGGGDGTFLRTLLRRVRHARGICFDRPPVVATAATGNEEVDGRLTFAGGDFFAEVPAGGDVYVLNRVVYGWDDERAAALLQTVHAAMAADGTLLVMEPLAGESDAIFDLLMLALSHGRTRTAQELEALLNQAGFGLAERLPVTPFPVLEARPLPAAAPARAAGPRALPRRFDPVELAHLDDPYPTYAELRAAGPVCRGGAAQWVIPRHADVTALLRDPRLAPFRYPEAFAHLPESELVRSLAAGPASTFTGNVMGGLDGTAHTAVRRTFSRAFQPILLELRHTIEQISGALVDDVLQRDTFDAIDDLGIELTMRVLSTLFGIPEADRASAARHAIDLSNLFAIAIPDEERQVGNEAITSLRALFGSLLRAREERPGDDFISRLAQLPGVAELDRQQVVDNMAFIFFAGFETSLGLIGNGCDALLRFPDEQRRLREDRSLVPSAVEEFLRFEAPVQLVGRRTVDDIELGGRTIRKNRIVYLMLGSANHDEEVFHEPGRLDVARSPNRHLSFSSGAHHCLGTALARMEAAALFGELLHGTRELERAAAPKREPSVHLRRFESVPVAATPV